MSNAAFPSYTGISPKLDKFQMLTAYGGSVISGPGSPCGQNCSYIINFIGPVQKCEDIANYTLHEDSGKEITA